MSYTDTPDSSQAKLTDIGRSYLNRSTIGDASFKLSGFDVGHSGYVDSNPVKILPIDQSSTALDDKYFPLADQENFAGKERPHSKTIVFNCRLGHSVPDNIGAIGEVGIWAEVMYSSVPSEIGTKFLFAIAHFPILVKNNQNVFVFRIMIQL